MTARSLGHRSAASRIIELPLSCKRCLRAAEPGSYLPALSVPFHCTRLKLSRCARGQFCYVSLSPGELSHFFSHLNGNLPCAACWKCIWYCREGRRRMRDDFSHFRRAEASPRYRSIAHDAQKRAISRGNDQVSQVFRTRWRGRQSFKSSVSPLVTHRNHALTFRSSVLARIEYPKRRKFADLRV